MIVKLITHTIRLIPTGRKIIFLFSTIVLLNGCGLFMWDKDYDYYYTIQIGNNTNDTLIIVFNDTVINNSVFNYTIFPRDTAGTDCGRNINEGEDIRRRVLSDGKHDLYEVVTVFRNDSLLIKWKKPSFESDSIHHFFNYNSWKSWLEDDFMGIVIFTIEESDFKSD